MNRKKIILLFGAVFLVWAANAQSTETSPPADTSHHHMMHHRWNARPGGPDSLAKRGFHAGPNGFRQPGGWAHAGPHGLHNRGYASRGRRFGRGRRPFIHYTPEQRKQVAAINKDYRQKREGLFKQDNITLKEYKQGLIALEKDRKSKLQGLLTPDQKSAMDARRKRQDDNRQVMAAAHLERLRLNLNLTDDQVARIKAGQRDLRTRAHAIHENDNLLPQEKHEQMKALMATRNDNFKSILTPEQYTKFQQMGHRRFGGPWQGHGSYSGRTTI